MITESELNAAYSDLSLALVEAYNAGFRAMIEKHDLEIRKAYALANGEIAGKNAEEREANARILLEDRYNALVTAEDRSAYAKLKVKLAELEVERCRALLRIAELCARSPGDGIPF